MLSDELLVEQIRQGEEDAWSALIARYEGRLLAFVQSRLGDRAASEDVVQEAFIGFLTSLPHYDGRRALESYLFGIAAHKLSDYLRRKGRRPSVALPDSPSGGGWEAMRGSARRASSIVRSAERRGSEEVALAEALKQLVAQWQAAGDWQRLKCIELLFVRGWANKKVAQRLEISEQTVANQKFQVLAKLRAAVAASGSPRSGSPPAAHVAPAAEDYSAPAAGTADDRCSDEELLAYLDEALPALEMVRIERALRDDAPLRYRLAESIARRDRGGHTVAEIWRRARITCLTRDQLGGYLLEVLDAELQDYAEFHLRVVGCRPCLASLEDLRREEDEQRPESHHRRRRFFQSSAGYLKDLGR